MINILMYPLWERERWGEGRTFEQVARNLASSDLVRNVACVFPAVTPTDYPAPPFHINRESRRLILISPNYYVIEPTSFPFRARKIINESARSLVGLYARTLGFDVASTVNWIFPPVASTMYINKIVPRSSLVVHIVDDFSKMTQNVTSEAREKIDNQYRKLAASADLVIVGSLANYEKFIEISKRCVLVPNGVDEIFLGKPKAPPFMKMGGKPVVLYVGFITERTDLALIEGVARARPNFDFVLAGSLFDLSASCLSSLLDCSNVRWLGHVPYHELPKLIQSADVCIAPHRDTPLSRSMSPLKIYQYLASGTPIVSTAVAGALDFAGAVVIADGVNDFSHALDRVLATDSVSASEERIGIAQKNTWRMRVDDMLAHLMHAV